MNMIEIHVSVKSSVALDTERKGSGAFLHHFADFPELCSWLDSVLCFTVIGLAHCYELGVMSN